MVYWNFELFEALGGDHINLKYLFEIGTIIVLLLMGKLRSEK